MPEQDRINCYFELAMARRASRQLVCQLAELREDLGAEDLGPVLDPVLADLKKLEHKLLRLQKTFAN